MNCPYCGTPIVDGGAFCPACGASVQAAPAAPFNSGAPADQSYAPVPPMQNVYYAPTPQGDDPRTFLAKYPEYQPLSAWAYFGLTLLYSVPIVGFIFLIIFSFNKSNLNRRSFTRSYWIGLLLVAIAAAILIGLGFSFTGLLSF